MKTVLSSLLILLMMMPVADAAQKHNREYVDYCKDSANIGCWHFNTNRNGKALEDSGKINIVGAVTGATYTEDCEVGDCYDYNGTTDYINLGNLDMTAVATSDEFTVMFWAEVDGDTFNADVDIFLDDASGNPSGNNGFFVAPDDRAGAGQPTNGILVGFDCTTLGVNAYADDLFTSTPTWYHITIVVSPSVDSIIYLNSVDVTTSNEADCQGELSPDANANLLLGSLNTGGANFFDGKIDELAMFSRVLTQPEIEDIYTNGLK